jgi:hypothetical protein
MLLVGYSSILKYVFACIFNTCTCVTLHTPPL